MIAMRNSSNQTANSKISQVIEAFDQRCGSCQRLPLVGERMLLFADGSELCELCSIDRPEAAISVSRVCSEEARGTVRLLGSLSGRSSQ